MASKKKSFAFLCFFLLLEGFARVFEDPHDINFLFGWEFFDTRLRMFWISKNQQGYSKLPLNSMGYRGTWEIEPKKDEIRIVYLGAGHGFADNIEYGESWSEQVEKSLSKSVQRKVDVWNFSVNGSTVIFAERCLLQKVLRYEPDLVIFSHSGYNEAIRTDVPDSTIVYDGFHPMNLLFSFATVRHGVLWGAKTWNRSKGLEKKPKVSIDEFMASYERMISQLKDVGIPILLLQQEVVTPDIPPFWFLADMERYKKGFHSLSQKHSLVYLNPKNLMHGNKDRYFDQEEYYSSEMHSSIAKEIEPYLNLLVNP